MVRRLDGCWNSDGVGLWVAEAGCPACNLVGDGRTPILGWGLVGMMENIAGR